MAFVKHRLIAGNWKMHTTTVEAAAFLRHFREALTRDVDVEIRLIPPFTALSVLRDMLRDDDPFTLGAQDVHWEDDGPHTGEISGLMLRDAGCRSVIVGHSERRRLFGDTDERINHKIHAAARHGLAPLLCVGETAEERDAGRTTHVVTTQLTRGLHGLDDDAAAVAGVTVAYEPVWAIGTGRAATVRQIEAAHASLRAALHSMWPRSGKDVRVIYGGSVSPDNARELLASTEIDGALVGRACLDPTAFATICRLASST